MNQLSYIYKVLFCLFFIPVFFMSCSSTAKRNLRCTYAYGGATTTIAVAPVEDPYTVEDIAITVKKSNSQGPDTTTTKFFLKIVYIEPPADDAAINIYVFHPSDDGPVLIHQLKYLPPFLTREDDQQFGFTGLQTVYEPTLGRVFQYWCRWE